MNVLVYTGPGTARGPVENTLLTLKSLLSSHYDVIPVDAETLLKEPWQHTTACLVIPGGRDLPYVEQLEPKGTQIVTDYVKNGGSYLGICAGAYFACSQVQFEVGRNGYEVIGKRGLAFWPGTGKGSVSDGFVYESERGARAIEVALNADLLGQNDDAMKSVRLYVNGGPWFDMDKPIRDAIPETSPNVLAWYAAFHGEKRPAIVECMVGKGRAILSGPHFEYRFESADHGDPDIKRISPALAASEPQRLFLARKILGRLGLKLNDEDTATHILNDMIRPKLSMMHLCADYVGREQLGRMLEDVTGNNMLSLNIPSSVNEDTVNLLRFFQHESDVHAADDIPKDVDALNIGDDTSQTPKPAVNILLYKTHLPSLSELPKFDMARYFSVLNRTRGNLAGTSTPIRHIFTFGSIVLYGELVGSTQTLLEKNLKLSASLPDGFVCVATHQIAGRGRGRNSWISQQGCLMFSFALEHKDARSVIFIQYLVALAIVEAVRGIPECEALPVHVKWPNDIYAQVGDGPEGLKKIGGILVTSSYQNGAFRLIIGCGLNVANPHPTLSINDLIRAQKERRIADQQQEQQALEKTSGEEVLARFMVHFEEMYREFTQTDGYSFAFERFLERYYDAWLHTNQLVKLEDRNNAVARIVGIDSSGLLRAVTVEGSEGNAGTEYLLQPDGNSFDMMRGLICRKK